MNEYIRLLEIVKNKMEIREDSFGSVIAAKIHNNEEFDLMISFWTVAYSSCYKREKIIGKFIGEDWYFIESDTTDYGMDGKSTTYFTQTLTEKKQKFFEFCRKFDADAVPAKHGHWIGKPLAGYSTVKCSACGSAFLENNGKWKYCPDCGAVMDAEEFEEPEINPCRGCEDYDGYSRCKSNGGCGRTEQSTMSQVESSNAFNVLDALGEKVKEDGII